MAESKTFWEPLLSGTDAKPVTMRLVRKRGEPFLLLPAEGHLAAKTLALYPAQTSRARFAKALLRLSLKAGLPLGTETVSVSISESNPLVQFLSETAGARANFGILSGNPNAPGQRFIFLVFDADGNPATVVKAGLKSRARELIQAEKTFLQSAASFPGIPRLRGSSTSGIAEALAMDFIEGESPRSNDEQKIPALLSSWIHPESKIKISETRAWNELKPACANDLLFQKVSERLKDKLVSPAVFHGDFAPWNIKVSAEGVWHVFDWERGDLNGLPGYDWFHYLIQTRILVRHASIADLIQELESLFASPQFQSYAARTNFIGFERELAAIYLLHHNEFIRPGEGLEKGRALLAAMKRWFD